MEYLAYTDTEYAAMLPAIASDAHKFSRGSLLVIGGSEHYSGAPILAAQAAARAGAGYVSLAVPSSVAPIAKSHLLSIPVLALPEQNGAVVECALEAHLGMTPSRYDALVLGPGLTCTSQTAPFIGCTLSTLECPAVLDADALNLIARHTRARNAFRLRTARGGALVLTPHAGELERLASAFRCEASAEALAACTGAVVVAKGPDTVIADGERRLVSSFGGPELARAGTGDCLAGVIGSLLAQGLAPFEAAALGVRLHSEAGRQAKSRLGVRSVMAEDLVFCLPEAIRSIESEMSS